MQWSPYNPQSAIRNPLSDLMSLRRVSIICPATHSRFKLQTVGVTSREQKELEYLGLGCGLFIEGSLPGCLVVSLHLPDHLFLRPASDPPVLSVLQRTDRRQPGQPPRAASGPRPPICTQPKTDPTRVSPIWPAPRFA
ncbi:hypothetical protein SODALDRAFT_189961 [Sodiomyces alkalinus F11]|uniref:Uncharacterized protein n=1 Tax=Sodiomyces alkalinus (strain CBS 110278 / VKM F-3762 / F11) TaxID=1314773 RepID=A0A3N2PRQ4_SODAK|nr:hypothetical protein SODALDRAFT_189961 [Sodiomyces alkalinus F11]ROT37175.1 hypothetical protein SODALDRAFT_189961 [Sodiomyces alkalinus F11]